ncbi:BnaC02g34130D [Brassica napus]|uniref:(rape) hypothetical protein n=1 Tax=Brassica napus TaxID=3708 RepID=A0A078FSB1_BRANA|nr:uroporphyrinogen decarboxylase 1, chloroplastic-like [Brassica napus]CAF1919777.1 unnamed protein product [Brassica napus]CDY15794.1 BnaC02g34130D [Brassica napus]
MKKFPALGHFANDRKEINEFVPSVNRTFLTLLTDLLLVNIAKGQAGRYTTIYQKLALKHPSFRGNTDLIMVISLQPRLPFIPDDVICLLCILTPLPAFGVLFDNEGVKDPVIQSPIGPEEYLKRLHPIDLEKLQFVGAPWTITTYIVEGGTTWTYTVIKSLCHTAPYVLRALLSKIKSKSSQSTLCNKLST